MFKKNILTLSILVLTFIVFTLHVSPKLQNEGMDKVAETCSISDDSKECKDAMNNVYQTSIKTGFLYIVLGLALISYAIYTVVKVGSYHADKNIDSIFYRITNKFYEFDDSVEQFILHTNKAYAPKAVNASEAHRVGLVPFSNTKGNSKHMFIYEKKEVQGQEQFVLVKSM